MKHADALAQVVDLDMVAAGWTPTVESYLGRVTKPRILEAVRDGKGDREAQLIEHLKKGDMAKEAERLLAGSGWLPEPLRTATDQPVLIEPDGSEPEALPARSEEHTSELQSLMRTSYAVFCLQKKK